MGDKVHEYGGGSLAIGVDGRLIFSDSRSSAVCVFDPKTETVEVIVRDPLLRFADFDFHPLNTRWVLAIQEDHTNPKPSDVRNTLVLVDVVDRTVSTLATGKDFYSQMRFSPDGKQICWLSWDHPEMPFTASLLRKADFRDGEISNIQEVAGASSGQSISQPRWGPDGSLFFSDDSSGFWQLQVLKPGSSSPEPVKCEGLQETEHAGAEFVLGR